jgi:hypothetical protein
MQENSTYNVDSNNYWVPLFNTEDHDDEEDKQPTMPTTQVQCTRRDLLCMLFGGKSNSTTVLDSGAMAHFVWQEDNLPILGPSHKRVQMPNGEMEVVSHRAKLPYSTLSNKAWEAHVLLALTHHSLISIPTLANEGYTTIFHAGAGGAEVYKVEDISFHTKGASVLQGCRKGQGLWTVTTSGSITKGDTINNVYSLPLMAKAIRFMHAAAGFPVKPTWLKAIKQGYFKTWPLLTAEAIQRHYPESDATIKGHLKKQRRNVRSTKMKIDNLQDNLPSRPETKAVYVKIFYAHNTVHTNQTGQMPVTSSRGNRLIMVLFEIDSNFIHAKPMQDSTDKLMINAYHKLWQWITASGKVKPKMHLLDNEASEAFKREIAK